MEFENEMHGGAVPIKTNSKTSRFELVYNMIQSATKIECISYNSLKGFVFSVEGDPQFKSVTSQLFTTEKRNLNLGKIILKFTILKEGKSNDKLPVFKMDFKEVDEQSNEKSPENKEINKETDKIDDFYKESFTQVDIFTRCFQIGKLSICPSVLTRTVIENAEANIFLDFFESKIDDSADIEKKVISYMKEQVEKYSLGIIAMEYADKFVLLNDFYKPIYKGFENKEILERIKNSPEKKFLTGLQKNIILLHRVALVLSNMLLLLFEFFYLHYDLHLNNVFVLDYNKSSSCDNFLDLLNPQNNTLSSCSRIIDFGRVYKIKTNESDELNKKIRDDKSDNIPTDETEKTLFSEYDEFIKLITENFNIETHFDEASNFIENFLTFIFIKDAEINKGRPQCFGIFFLGGLAEKPRDGTYKLKLGKSANRDYIFFLIIKYFRTIYEKQKQKTQPPRTVKQPRDITYKYNILRAQGSFTNIFNEKKEDELLKKGDVEHSLPAILFNMGLDILEKKGVTSEKIKIQDTKLTIEPKMDELFLGNMNNVIKQLGGTIEFTI
jgi:hypothetical protein